MPSAIVPQYPVLSHCGGVWTATIGLVLQELNTEQRFLVARTAVLRRHFLRSRCTRFLISL